jgi:large subunit ribosomal protein L25
MLLKAQKRELLGKKVSSLRKNKLIPAVSYTKGKESTSLVISEKELLAVFKKVGYSSLFDLQIEEGKAEKALFKDVQIDYLRSKILHAGIYLVDMANKITTTVPVRIEGISMAIKNNLGLLVTPLSAVTVHCLPGNLPQELVVDISKLDNVGDSIFLKDMVFPEGVEVAASLSKDSIVAAIVTPQKAIEEEVVATTTVEGAEGTEGAVEGAVEGAEGAAGGSTEGGAKGEASGDKKTEGGAKKERK